MWANRNEIRVQTECLVKWCMCAVRHYKIGSRVIYQWGNWWRNVLGDSLEKLFFHARIKIQGTFMLKTSTVCLTVKNPLLLTDTWSQQWHEVYVWKVLSHNQAKCKNPSCETPWSLEKTSVWTRKRLDSNSASAVNSFWLLNIFSSRLYGHPLPVHHLPRLRGHVPRIHHAAVHAQQPSAGKSFWPKSCTITEACMSQVKFWCVQTVLSCHPKPFKVCLWLLVKASAVCSGL